jgi:hypothetical protein
MIKTKICLQCNIEQPLDIEHFYFNNRKMRNGEYKRYFKTYCIECSRKNIKQYREDNPDKIKEYNKSENHKIASTVWVANNQERQQEYGKRYYLNNKEKFQQRSQTAEFKNSKRIYKKKRKQRDPLFKIRNNFSNRINKTLRHGKTSKAGQSYLKYLGYTIIDLKQHLEAQFTKDMNWDNYGTFWHIDHIIPHSTFHYTSMDCQEFRDCWGLSNLRPLEAKQNIIDGATRIRHKKP